MVDLLCPNCGKRVGYAKADDGYKHHIIEKCVCDTEIDSFTIIKIVSIFFVTVMIITYLISTL